MTLQSSSSGRNGSPNRSTITLSAFKNRRRGTTATPGMGSLIPSTPALQRRLDGIRLFILYSTPWRLRLIKAPDAVRPGSNLASFQRTVRSTQQVRALHQQRPNYQYDPKDAADQESTELT